MTLTPRRSDRLERDGGGGGRVELSRVISGSGTNKYQHYTPITHNSWINFKATATIHNGSSSINNNDIQQHQQ
jgi:hypothetical protein